MWYFCLVAQTYPTTIESPVRVAKDLGFALPPEQQQPAVRPSVQPVPAPPAAPPRQRPRRNVRTAAAHTMDSVSTAPFGPPFRESLRTVGFSGPPSPKGWEDRPFCSSLGSSDTSG